MPSISVVIPTWNNADLTIRCLRSLRDHTEAELHIAWIDNGSTPEQHEQVKAEIQSYAHDHEYHDAPLGFARAVNRGLALTGGDYCVILNNDVEVLPGWDTELRDAVDDSPGIAGPICVNASGWQDSREHAWLEIPETMTDPREIGAWLCERWRNQRLELPSPAERPGFRDMLAFFCVLLPRDVQRQIGDLDENYGWGYYEDNDYCMRVRRAGYAVTLCPASTVLHKVSQTLRFIQDDYKDRLYRNFQYYRRKFDLP